MIKVIYGNTVGVPTPRSDWAQTDEKKADYIKNKPELGDVLRYTEQSLTEEQQAQARANIGAGSSGFSGSYNDLTDKPVIPSTDGLATEQLVADSLQEAKDYADNAMNARIYIQDTEPVDASIGAMWVDTSL